MTARRAAPALSFLALSLLAAPAAAGIGDGPRAYAPAPTGTNLLTFSYIHQSSGFNIDGSPAEPAARIRANVLAVQYTYVTELFGQTAGVFAALPVGGVDGTLVGTGLKGRASGLGDVQFGGVVSLFGAPAMTPKEYGAAAPVFNLGLLAKVLAPTGEYSAAKTINLGTNRWAVQIGAPMTWNIRGAYRPGQVTTLEVTPAVWLYADNGSPTGGAGTQSRDPLVSIEAHLTHDFSARAWGSLDAFYSFGGGTRTDGVDDDNAADTAQFGVTFGVGLGAGYALQMSYGQTFHASSDGLDDTLFRVKFSKAF